MNCGPQKCSLALAGGPDADLRPSSRRFSIANGLRLSVSVFFLISLAVCRLPLFCSACRGQRTESSFTQESAARCSEEERRRSPRLPPWPGTLRSERPCWTAPSSSWPRHRPSSWPLRPPSSVSPPAGKKKVSSARCPCRLSTARWCAEQLVDRRWGFSSICSTMSKMLIITAMRVCRSRSFSALTRCCSALSARRLSCDRKWHAVFLQVLKRFTTSCKDQLDVL